ncbi:uncharacterized protein LOC106051069 [Biomphalaria glabrata]|uniref:Uncharacterized protein LOC106051069 n=1 Tax=Biomphalaria glabrata TaxID=6526 RepID=A0A2C9L6F2_BIOGL|nr:uncharacterized protein LOC106051069 [Biomphalaria glabrata]XP_013061662.1 uncharacterized protein LOC106051069 [Biomphalaria glabrata]XP_055899538.1 uncharacterized protein LOC106051069 [Biomphalaria glabrata]
MDFNPLDILAAAALGVKDAQPEVNASRPEPDKSDESNDDYVDTSTEMGKTTRTGLKETDIDSRHSEQTMAPQKIDWSPETFLSSHLDGLSEKFSLDELVSDLKKKSLEFELHKIVEQSILKSDAFKDLSSNVTSHEDQNVKTVSEHNAINKETNLNVTNNVQTLVTEPKEETANSQSDIDSTDSKSPEIVDTCSEMTHTELIALDHSYALIPGKAHFPSFGEDDDIDVCSDHSPLTEETEQRSRNLSVDFNYLKSGIKEGVSASTLDFYQMSASMRSKLPSTSSSSSSPIADVSKSPSYNDGASPAPGAVSPAHKYGKFKIGTLGSFSSGNLELEKYLKNKDMINSRKLKLGIPMDMGLTSPAASPSSHPLPPSPCLDWDRSEASSETQEDSSDARTPLRLSPDITAEKEWSHPMYHDHDYCTKTEPRDTQALGSLLSGKRKYTKRKNKYDGMSHEKFMKAKYLKKELLKQDSFIKTPSEQELLAVDSASLKSNPVGRPRKRPIEKMVEEEIDPATGSKLKITGKFQDQYVYYMSKTSRATTRRRQAPLFPPSADRIIVPAPKPGDIVVPHLTDADIETVRVKGRGALNLPDRPHSSSNRSTDLISDVDSHIVSTILSMESDNLASPTTAHAPDIHPSELNLNQPALTESLRLVSGDSSITSEHVLNYLLSVVKDESLLNAASHFVDGTGGSMFPSLTDTMYSKSDHNDVLSGTDLLDMGKTLQGQFCHSNLSHKELSEGFGHSELGKDHLDECVGLPDDLTSFMSNSQGTSSSSNTTQDGDCHGSLKSMFGPDLSSLDSPHMSSSVPRLTSIEKTLDYLGVRDDDIKLHSVYADTDSEPLTPLSCTSDDTPWIVTVTLYFNDVPAIMINNQPYIRLVDIHKQILPAKDTGILKKRCQLLKIPVLNCTEMQRYFLVQYGRAYNSKSTLVVSKEQATHLVTYYATPQPRVGRSEDSHQRQASSSGGSECGTRSPVASLSTGIFKKRSNKSSKKAAAAPTGSGDVSLKAGSKETEVKHSKRTRHKKVNYLEMLKGEEKDKSTTASILETIESVLNSGPDTHSKTQFLNRKGETVSKKNSAKKTKVTLKGKKKHFKWNSKETQKMKDGKSGSEKLLEKQLEQLSDIDSDDTDAAQHKKFKPLKLKVNSLINLAGQRKSNSPNKKGLFSRSNSMVSSTDRPSRVLAVAHQAAVSGTTGESHLPSQPADIHLDLFTKSNSACVRCETCSQFLSVPHFMRHHHVPMDSEWLATEAAHRILVPRNKENISEQEKQLWEEFHKLQESIGGFGEADDETDTDDGDYDDCVDGPSHFELTSVHSGKQKRVCRLESSSEEDSVDMDLPGSPEIQESAEKNSSPVASRAGLRQAQESNTSHLRTSSRPRKCKQLFSIENYYTPKRWSAEEESQSRSDNSASGNGVSLQSRSRISS